MTLLLPSIEMPVLIPPVFFLVSLGFSIACSPLSSSKAHQENEQENVCQQLLQVHSG